LDTYLQELCGGILDHEEHEMSEHRATANVAMYQAILHLVGHIASGRAEGIRSFSQKNSQRDFFVKKKRVYHAAAGESGFHQVKRPVCMFTA